MTTREFTAVYQNRKGHYIAWIEEIPGVNAQGKTKQETSASLQEALSLILETNRILSRNEEKYKSIREPFKIGVPAFA
ncbi:MAG: type II toxin-antitoxin system HicB family antitoxin [Candidatus Jacksonbacteria bacterium]|nr:type II toxin-antitoxin system HicB family antitoxin [Candidatus Jacksonbacteria bacterium]